MLHNREKLLKHIQICFSLWLFILYVLNAKIIVPGLAESVKSLKVQLESCLNSFLREGERNAECVNCPSEKKKYLEKENFPAATTSQIFKVRMISVWMYR